LSTTGPRARIVLAVAPVIALRQNPDPEAVKPQRA
jgi:hypothetical protein